jgi:hypothetical protein
MHRGDAHNQFHLQKNGNQEDPEPSECIRGEEDRVLCIGQIGGGFVEVLDWAYKAITYHLTNLSFLL